LFVFLTDLTEVTDRGEELGLAESKGVWNCAERPLAEIYSLPRLGARSGPQIDDQTLALVRVL
jgi:hypothetical protein